MRTIRTKLFLIGCFAATMVVTTSCSKNNPLNPLGCGNGTWALQVSDEAAAWGQAASAYSSDPSPANCTSYKNAANNYLNALEGVRGCVAGVSQAEFNEAINEAKNEVDETDCSG
jgi:hypothetical protein